MIAIWSLALCTCLWIVALNLGSQAAIAGALVMTLTLAGVLAIYLILLRSQDRPSGSDR